MALTLVVAGCANPAPTTPPATTPPAVATPVAPAPPVKVEQGSLSDVSKEKSTVTVQTPAGPKTLDLLPSSSLSLQGQACTLDQLAALQDSGGNYDCSVVYDADGNVAALNVYKVSPPASVKGTIGDVNIQESTITVKTGSGDKVFKVDQDTGVLIGGVACSLELVNALVDAGGQLPCTVIYDKDAPGGAVYVDIANPPNLTAGTGTIQSVDVEKSTVTIQTDKGERTFQVNAKTGEFLNGQVCSLTDVQAVADLGGQLASCEVLYYTDASGNLVYLDINRNVK
jgi:hypothetical protein